MKKLSFASLFSISFLSLVLSFALFASVFSNTRVFSATPADAATSTQVFVSGGLKMVSSLDGTTIGVGGATVELRLSADNSVLGTALTAVDGSYSFPADSAGSYLVCLTTPSGYVLLSGSSCQPVVFPPDGNVIITDFSISSLPVITLIGTASVNVQQNSVYVDKGATAVKDTRDLTSQIVVSAMPTTTTPGVYTITYSLTDSQTAIAAIPVTRSVVVLPKVVAPVLPLDFGGFGEFSSQNAVSVSGFVRVGDIATDTNAGISGVTVELRSSTSTVVASGITIGDGSYSISVVPGNYDACVIPVSQFDVLPSVPQCHPIVWPQLGDATTTDFTISSIPTVALMGQNPVYVVIGNSYTDLGASSTKDKRDLSSYVVATGTVDTTTVGSYTVTYSVTDPISSMSASTSRSIIVSAAAPINTPPTITLNGSSTIALTVGDLYVELGATTTDAQDGASLPPYAVTGTVNSAIAGTYTLTYTVTDLGGLSASTTRTVTVAPHPLISVNILGAVRVGDTALGSNPGSPGTLIDLRDASTSVVASTSTDALGLYSFNLVPGVYSVCLNDPVGYAQILGTNCQSVVFPPTGDATVADFTISPLPVITLVGSSTMSVLQGSVFTDPGATSTKGLVDTTSSISVVIGPAGLVDTSVPGTYTITYSIYDAITGVTADAIRTVTVDPAPPTNTPPTIALLGASTINLNVGDLYVEFGATSSDAEDATTTVVITGTVNTAVAGTYTLTYTVTDQGGLSASTTRTVIVSALPPANTPPVITLIGSNPVSVTQGTTYVDAGATALDAQDGVLVVTIDQSAVNTAVLGAYTVNFSVTDSNNATTTATRTVNVVAAIVPPPTPVSSGGSVIGGYAYGIRPTLPTVSTSTPPFVNTEVVEIPRKVTRAPQANTSGNVAGDWTNGPVVLSRDSSSTSIAESTDTSTSSVVAVISRPFIDVAAVIYSLKNFMNMTTVSLVLAALLGIFSFGVSVYLYRRTRGDEVIAEIVNEAIGEVKGKK